MTRRSYRGAADQILSNEGKETTTTFGENLAQALDINTWVIVKDTIPERTSADQAEALEEADDLLRRISARVTPSYKK